MLDPDKLHGAREKCSTMSADIAKGFQPQRHNHLGPITVTQGGVGSGEPDYRSAGYSIPSLFHVKGLHGLPKLITSPADTEAPSLL